jgi:Holliday junction resolvase RusA-like endonuclease
MSRTLTFFAAGHAKTKGSLDLMKTAGGRTYARESVDPEGKWRTAVAVAAVEAMTGKRPAVTSYRNLTDEMRPALPIAGKDMAVAVSLVFWLPAPRGAQATAQGPVRHGTGDLDKLTRLVLDALQDAGVIEDDACVVRVAAAKDWALPDFGDVPGCDVSVMPLPLAKRSEVRGWVKRAWDALFA